VLTSRPIAIRPRVRYTPREAGVRPVVRRARWGANRSRQICGGVAVLGLVAAGLAISAWAPWRVASVPTIPTGAGFNVTVARSQDDAYATSIANRVEGVGLPGFTRALGKGRSREVVVGPYVSIGEAISVERMLARQGFGTQLLVDESVRRAHGQAEAANAHGGVTALLIAGGGRLSVVIEMPVEPRLVLTRDPDPEPVEAVRSVDPASGGGLAGPPAFTTLEINAGPVPGPVNFAQWRAPAGVTLFQDLSIERVQAREGPSIRIRMAVSTSAGANVRTAGTRLYVDLWPLELTPEPGAVVQAAVAAPRERAIDDYPRTIRPAIDKFDAIEPFLLSALGSPTPEVLSALRRTLQGLDQWMRTVKPPLQWQDAHYSLVAAVTLTAEALSPAFTGDRAKRVGEGFARREQVKIMLGDAPPATH
jgi:hypothetical protein